MPFPLVIAKPETMVLANLDFCFSFHGSAGFQETWLARKEWFQLGESGFDWVWLLVSVLGKIMGLGPL